MTSGEVEGVYSPLSEVTSSTFTGSKTLTDLDWSDFDTSAPTPTQPVGTRITQMQLSFDSVTNDLAYINFTVNYFGVKTLFYSVNCSLVSCAGLGVTVDTSAYEVTFANSVIAITDSSPGFNSATAPITLSGTLNNSW